MNRKYFLVLFLTIGLFSLSSSLFAAVLISEIAPGVKGVNTAEFVELYNTGSSPVDMNGWTLVRQGRTGGADTGTLTITGTIPAQGYYLLTGGAYNNVRATYPLGDQNDDSVTGTFFSVNGNASIGLSASSGQIGLKDGSGTLLDAVGYWGDSNTNPTGVVSGPYVEGTPKTLAGFSSSKSIYRDETTHADTNNNNVDFVYPSGNYMSPTNSHPTSVVISEVAPGILGNNAAQFVELYNTTTSAVDLSNWKLAYRGTADVSDVATITLTGSIPAQGYYLVTGGQYNTAKNGQFANGDFDDAAGAVVGALSPAGAQIGLKDSLGNTVDAVGYAVGSSFTGAYVEGTSKLITGSFSGYRSIYRNETSKSDTNNNNVDFTYPTTDYMTPTNSTGATFAFAYPYLTYKNDPKNSIVVNWWNPNGTGNSRVDYGLTSAYGSTVTSSSVSNFHHMEITGLSPNTTYHYKISSNDGMESSDNTFKTANPDAGIKVPLKFAIFGDTRGNGPGSDSYHARHKVGCDYMLSKGINFALQTGDLINEGSNIDDWRYFFWAEQNLTKNVAMIPSMGNHEVQPGGQPYYYYFDLFGPASMPNNGISVDSNARVYSFNYGPVHFISLSSFQVDINAQKAWVDADLAAAKADPTIVWNIVYFHFPMYTSSGNYTGNTTERDAWGPVFDKYNVDLVFGGHNHNYEKTFPIYNKQIASTGTRYITSGAGGAGFDSFNSTLDDHLFIQTYFNPSSVNLTCACYITIDGGVLTMQAITTDGTVRDSLTIDKSYTAANSWELYE